MLSADNWCSLSALTISASPSVYRQFSALTISLPLSHNNQCSLSSLTISLLFGIMTSASTTLFVDSLCVLFDFRFLFFFQLPWLFLLLFLWTASVVSLAWPFLFLVLLMASVISLAWPFLLLFLLMKHYLCAVIFI